MFPQGQVALINASAILAPLRTFPLLQLGFAVRGVCTVHLVHPLQFDLITTGPRTAPCCPFTQVVRGLCLWNAYENPGDINTTLLFLAIQVRQGFGLLPTSTPPPPLTTTTFTILWQSSHTSSPPRSACSLIALLCLPRFCSLVSRLPRPLTPVTPCAPLHQFLVAPYSLFVSTAHFMSLVPLFLGVLATHLPLLLAAEYFTPDALVPFAYVTVNRTFIWAYFAFDQLQCVCSRGGMAWLCVRYGRVYSPAFGQ
jgi:hypothetical protein